MPAGLEQISIEIKNNKVVGGELVEMTAFGDDIIYIDKDGIVDMEDDRSEVSLVKNVIDISNKAYFDMFKYSLRISKDNRKAYLKG